MANIDSTDARLSIHEAVCAERYAGLDRRMTNIDEKFNKLEGEVKDLKEIVENHKNLLEEDEDN